MHPLSASQLSRRLADRIESVCKELLPNGVRRYGRWEAGSVRGEAGSSLKVELSGEKKGIWADFATNESGDLLDLWVQVRRLSVGAAMKEAAAFLGLRLDGEASAPHKVYKTPAKPSCKRIPEDHPMMQWLKGRGFTEETINKYRLAVNSDGELVMPYIKHGKFLNAKYRKLPKSFRQESGAQPTLFGWGVLEEQFPQSRHVIITEGECVVGDTQLLTPDGWICIKDYTAETVAQWNNGHLEFVTPLAFINKPFDGELIEYQSQQFYSITTPGHKMVSLDKHGRPYFHTAQEGPKSSAHHIPRCGVLDGPGIPLSNAQIALCLAVSADAAIDVRKNAYGDGPARKEAIAPRYARFGFKKQRKINRLERITQECGITISNNPISNGYRSMCFGIPDWVPGRMLPWEWIELATAEQREFILSELIEWDGNRVPNRTMTEYSSKLIENAEWVQAMAHTAGRCSTIVDRENEFGEWFKVTILNNKSTSNWQSVRMDRIPYTGTVYCVQVPSGAIMVRHNGIVSISGNCDAMALYQYGFPALSVPMGGGGGRKQDWIQEDFDELAQFDTIYIATDMDEAGDRAAEEITKRLGAERCRRVTLPFKDANEMLMKGMTADDIQAALRSAKSNDPVELKRAGHFTDEVLELFAGGGALGSVGVRTPWGKDEFRLRPGELTIVAGYSGSGKSTLLSQMAIDGMMQGSRWCIASMEMPARSTIGGMVQAITQTPTPDTNLIKLVVKWLDSRLWVFDVRGSAQTDRLLTVFDYAARRYSISHFVVDSLAKCGMAEDDYNGQKKFVEQLTDLNHAHGCNTSLVAHSRKGESESVRPRKHDVRGATAITDMADNVMTVWRNKSDEHENKAELIFDKQRLTGWEGTINLNYDPICKQFLYGADGPKDYLRMIQ